MIYSDIISYVLTPREHQVAYLVACGGNNKAVCEELHIRERTCKYHIGHLFHKMGITSCLNNRSKGALMLWREGWLKIDYNDIDRFMTRREGWEPYR